MTGIHWKARCISRAFQAIVLRFYYFKKIIIRSIVILLIFTHARRTYFRCYIQGECGIVMVSAEVQVITVGALVIGCQEHRPDRLV